MTDINTSAGALLEALNHKADLDLNNANPSQAFTSQSVSLAMPSDKYVDISGNSYTAPTNGYVYHQSAMPKHGSVVLKNTTTGMATMEAAEYATARNGFAYIPVRKGDSVMHADNGTGHAYTTTYFRFYYAQGEI